MRKYTPEKDFCPEKSETCHLRIKSALFFDDLKIKSALT